MASLAFDDDDEEENEFILTGLITKKHTKTHLRIIKRMKEKTKNKYELLWETMDSLISINSLDPAKEYEINDNLVIAVVYASLWKSYTKTLTIYLQILKVFFRVWNWKLR